MREQAGIRMVNSAKQPCGVAVKRGEWKMTGIGIRCMWVEGMVKEIIKHRRRMHNLVEGITSQLLSCKSFHRKTGGCMSKKKMDTAISLVSKRFISRGMR
jgi:hypothetical protein